MPGDDTTTRITILDEDQPGTICFEETQLDVARGAEEIEIKVCRVDGADGQVSCVIKTEACGSTAGLGVEAAEPDVHYEPMMQKVLFKHGETEKVVAVKLIKETEKAEETAPEGQTGGGGGEEEEGEGPADLMFRVVLEKPEPEVVKLTRKNVAFVTIVGSEGEADLKL